MGLLNRIRNIKSRKTPLATAKEELSSPLSTPVSQPLSKQISDQLDEKPSVSAIKEKIEQELKQKIKQQIKKEETASVKEPTIDIENTRIKTLRPLGALKAMQRPKVDLTPPAKAGLDIKSIKESIEKELHGSAKKQKPTIAAGRTATGIPGLDGVMSGGYRKNTVNLVVGGPGSGKSTFATQFLVDGIEQGESAVYISFEQTESEIISGFEQFGWGLNEKIEQKKLVFMTYTPEQVEKVLQAGGGSVRDVVESIGAKKIVIDSLTAFTLLHESALAQRKACISLFSAIKKWGCTALLIAEHEPDPERRSPSVEEFEVDGVILLYNIRKGDIRQRALEIFKMRGTKHSPKLFPVAIGEQGFVIYPDQEIF
jgi:KaiC/GvpD/RAD55 family RecA-like ATPase